jgi:hypothetical protein
LTAFYLHQSRMNIGFSGFDDLHLLGGRAGGASKSSRYRPVSLWFALALTLASLPDDDLLGRVQLPFLGS